MEYLFKTTPLEHQLREFREHRETRARAIFWEQGTGKSKLIIDTACWLWLTGQIDAVCVVAPNGVHRNWVEEEVIIHVPDHVMPAVRAFAFRSDRAETKWHKEAVRAIITHPGFAWFTISYDAFTTAAGKRALIDFFDRRRLLYVLDESHYVKNPDAARTQSILKSARYSEFRRCLTGTPIAQGPFDAYPQIKFLDPGYWERAGFSSFVAYKHHFGEFEKGWNPTAWNPKTRKRTGNEYERVVGYRRLDQLYELLAPLSTRVLKEDVLDLPPKTYAKEVVRLSAAQADLYQKLRDEYIVWLESGAAAREAERIEAENPEQVCGECRGAGEVEHDGYIYPCPSCAGAERSAVGTVPVIAALAMTRLLRLQQIICGYLPTDTEAEPIYRIPGPNPRLEALCRLVETSAGKVIVWARFQEDITQIIAALSARGKRVVRYDGLATDDERAEAKARFQGVRALYRDGLVVGRVPVPEEEQADVWAGNQASGGAGLTLTAGKTVIYYSNSFKLIDRLQSEDRAHRIGQDKEVKYIDLVAEGTVDEKIVSALRNKFNIASQITGDKLREWI